MIIQQQILPQIQNKHEQFLHCGLSKNMDWQLMTDQQLQQYQNQLLSLYQGLDPQQQISQQGFNLTKIQDKKPIQSLRFKELFFDSLEGNSHQILSLGFVQNQLQYKKLENQILKQTVSILFQISQKEKTFYPHLFTHIKQQFYKPNILTDLSQSDKQQSKYFQLINDFFNQSWQAPKYEQFIINNPQFQQICIFIFGKIAREDKRLLQINDCYHQSANSETKVFNLIEKICKKFLIETSYFGYQTPSIEMIAIGNEERFIFINDSNHLFVIKLQKLQLLNVRRKSSHNISVTNNEQTSNQSKNQKDKKKIKAKESYRIAYFGGQKTPENFQIQKSCFNMADEDDTSNFDSSFMKSQSKANQLSDQSTPKFKNSSISHARKKSHKDSFGGVDFDNLVYKDLSNPKRHILQKTRLKDLQINISHQKNNKKVLSQRFETNQIGSLTCGQDEDSQIEFLPHFQMQGTIQDQNSLSLFGNTPNSPAYSYQNHHINFSSFHLDAEFENPKNILTKKMKTSNIETSSKFFNYEDQYNFEQPNFLQQTNYNKQKFVPNRQNFNGNRVLATSQIIQFSGTQQNNHFQKKFDQMQETEDFLIIPSMSSKKESANQGFQGKSLTSVPHKEVFMSFSKNDKQKFLIPDIFVSDFQRPVNQQDKIRLTQKRFEKKDRSKNFQHDAYEITESQTNKSQSRNYVFWTEKQEREKYRSKLRLQNQSSLSHKSFKNLIAKDQSLIKLNKCHSAYQKYQNDSKKNIQVHYENTQEIENKQSKSHIFNSNLSQNLKLQRKHSSNIPVYQAVESPQQGQVRKSPELNFVNTRQQVSKRFQQNSVRFSQIIENQDDQIFYVKTKEDRKQGFGNKKQRKVTDIYEGPLVNVKKNGNKTSQVIQNSRDRQLKEQSNNFQSHLSINQDKLNVLINSGGGKNYSVLSNVSYDEQKRLQDLLEMESHLNNKNNQILASKVNHNNSNQYPTGNYFESELDFGNFQTVEKLIFRKKQQKNKLQTDLISISISNQSSKKIQQEPLNWYKKEVFYFFQPATAGVVLPPVKRVILNSNQQKQKQHLFSTNKNNNNKPFNFNNSNSNRAFINNNNNNNNSNKKDSMNSSTSLYNFSLVKNQQQPKQSQQRQGFVENSKGLFERKYSTQQIRPVVMEFRNQQMIGNSQRYCNQKYESCSNFGESSKSGSFVIQRNYSPTPIYMRQNNQNQNQHYYDGMNRNGDKLSVGTLEPLISSQRNSQFGQFTTKQGVTNDNNKQQQIRTNQVTRQYNKQQQQPRIKFIWHNNQPSYHQYNNQPSYHQYNHQPVYSSSSQLIPSMTSMSSSIGKN